MLFAVFIPVHLYSPSMVDKKQNNSYSLKLNYDLTKLYIRDSINC